MELEQRLAAAKVRVTTLAETLVGPHPSGDWDEFRAARAALLDAERAYAASRNEEHAVPLVFPARWDVGAPLPHVVMNDHKAFLIFLVRTIDPNWDGTYVTIQEPGSDDPRPLALVEFTRCASAKLGDPNDEVFHGHSLSGKGLEGYTAQLVKNSRWLAELEQINTVHSCYRPERWSALNHYVLWFHDSTFECIAESFTVERHECSIPELLAEACRRLVA